MFYARHLSPRVQHVQVLEGAEHVLEIVGRDTTIGLHFILWPLVNFAEMQVRQTGRTLSESWERVLRGRTVQKLAFFSRRVWSMGEVEESWYGLGPF